MTLWRRRRFFLLIFQKSAQTIMPSLLHKARSTGFVINQRLRSKPTFKGLHMWHSWKRIRRNTLWSPSSPWLIASISKLNHDGLNSPTRWTMLYFYNEFFLLWKIVVADEYMENRNNRRKFTCPHLTSGLFSILMLKTSSVGMWAWKYKVNEISYHCSLNVNKYCQMALHRVDIMGTYTHTWCTK